MSELIGMTPLLLMLLLAMSPAIFMFVMILKGGTEKERKIIEKTCLYTLPLYTLNLMLNTISSLFGWTFGQTLNSNLTSLLFIGVLFIVVYIYVKIKFQN
ncbi:hypothetical protein [Candidatus Epulonipiscium viviparus]|uniref:hypothetical protein n=1 Tax=Candidatus Epulonipiscium viviparus TaxID=420336 RepID=UPI00016BFD99|nr:hypothetical protein [Candidatus Epulopiscium viviparus]